MSLLRIIGIRITKRRIKLGFSQEKLAELSKVHRTYIGCVERAEKSVTVKVLHKISKALEYPLEQLFKDY